MEFYFPADVYASMPGQPRQAPRQPRFAAGGAAPGVFSGCGFDGNPFFDGDLGAAIRAESAAHAARARAEAQRAKAEALQRAKAARRAAEEQRRAAEERRVQAYLEHMLRMQEHQELMQRQREAQRQHHIQLQRQRQREREEAHRRQYEEYQRRKAYTIERERERAAARRAAQNPSQHLFFALGDLLFGGFQHLHDDDNNGNTEDDDVASSFAQPSTSTAVPAEVERREQGKGKARETEEGSQEQAMDVDDAAPLTSATTSAPVTDDDPAEVGPIPSTEVKARQTPVSSGEASSQGKTHEEVLVFEHPFPADDSQVKSSVQSDSIRVSVDEEKRKVTVSGLWNNEPAASLATPTSPARSTSPTLSDSSGSRRGRSHSPKRARVSDVDENGEEIVVADTEQDHDFVEVSFTPAVSAKPSAPSTALVEKTFDLPENSSIEDLRAELSDHGLKLFTTTTTSKA